MELKLVTSSQEKTCKSNSLIRLQTLAQSIVDKGIVDTSTANTPHTDESKKLEQAKKN